MISKLNQDHQESSQEFLFFWQFEDGAGKGILSTAPDVEDEAPFGQVEVF